MNSYTPQPGTTPFRVIAHLQTLPAGTELTTAQLCDALGRDDPNGFSTCMLAAARSGLVKQARRPGSRLAYWSLGNGNLAQEAAPAADDDAEDEPRQSGDEVVAAACSAPRSVWDLAGGLGWKPPAPTSAPEKSNIDPVGEEELADAIAASAMPGIVQTLTSEQPMAVTAELRTAEVAQAPQAAAEEAQEPFVCALWSDGSLQLMRGGEELALLALDETKALLQYLKWTGALDAVQQAARGMQAVTA